jgi:hypothetical protein
VDYYPRMEVRKSMSEIQERFLGVTQYYALGKRGTTESRQYQTLQE